MKIIFKVDFIYINPINYYLIHKLLHRRALFFPVINSIGFKWYFLTSYRLLYWEPLGNVIGMACIFLSSCPFLVPWQFPSTQILSSLPEA